MAISKRWTKNCSGSLPTPSEGRTARIRSFTPIQKAISYSMTSFFTTGGIRGGKKKMDKFYPRSFNMGLRAKVYKELGGFSKMRFGEDIDLSIRIFKGGYSCRLFPEAWVWHKRRTDLKKFFKQVHNSGIARINLYKKYPESLKLVHLLPMVFTVGVVALLIVSISIGGWIGLTWCFQMTHHYPYAVEYPLSAARRPTCSAGWHGCHWHRWRCSPC
jgi:GT2 family glycosyltransferase